MFLLHGAGYAASARGDTLTRFFSVIGGHGGTILFYIPILLLGFFPWSGVLPSALVGALRERRSGEHTSELQSQSKLVCRLFLEKKKKNQENRQSQPHKNQRNR